MSLTELTYQDILNYGIKMESYTPGIWCVKKLIIFPFESEYTYRFSKPRDFKEYLEVKRLTNTLELFPDQDDRKRYPEFNIIDSVSYTLKDGSVVVFNGCKSKPKIVLIPKLNF